MICHQQYHVHCGVYGISRTYRADSAEEAVRACIKHYNITPSADVHFVVTLNGQEFFWVEDEQAPEQAQALASSDKEAP